jgi:hypothetical protein
LTRIKLTKVANPQFRRVIRTTAEAKTPMFVNSACSKRQDHNIHGIQQSTLLASVPQKGYRQHPETPLKSHQPFQKISRASEVDQLTFN